MCAVRVFYALGTVSERNAKLTCVRARRNWTVDEHRYVDAVNVAADWSPNDHFGLWQLVVAILGLAFAGWQLWRTRVASEASQRAVEASQQLLARRLLVNDLLVLLPEVHRLEEAFEKASRTGDRELTADALRAYVQRIPTIVGHLKADPAFQDEPTVRLLTQAVAAAGGAKGDLFTRTTDSMDAILKTTRRRMTAATIEISEMTARLQKTPEASR